MRSWIAALTGGARLWPPLIVILSVSPAMLFADWSLIGPFGGAAEFVRVSKSQPDTLVAGTRRGMIFRSVDRGMHWTPGPSPAASDCVLHALEIDPHDAAHLYAGFGCEITAAGSGL